MLSRRTLVGAALLAGPAMRNLPANAAPAADGVQRQFAALEHRYGGRLGVAILDTGTKKLIARRGHERFRMCSTHKLISAAYVLARVDRGEEKLNRRIIYSQRDLVAYSPVTGKHAGCDGLTVGELCEAAVTLSDNTAANLLLDSFGGAAQWTAFIRSLGDNVSRLDRREPELNYGDPDDPRDTTTPVAMLHSMQKVVLGKTLSSRSRAQLITWLVACKTGGKRLRAGIPHTWRAGDKTGSGGRNGANDVAVFFPPRRSPILVTAYYMDSRATAGQRDAVLAAVGRLAAEV